MQRWRPAHVWPHEEAAKQGGTESLEFLFKGTRGRGKEKEVLFWAQLSPGSIWHCPPAFRGPRTPSLCMRTDTRICQTDTCLDQYGVHRSPRTPDPPFKGNYGNLVFANFTSAVPSLALQDHRNKSVGRQEDSSRSA